MVSFSRVAKVLEDLGDVTPSEPVLLSRAADEKAGLCVRMAGTDADFGPALALAELEEHAVSRWRRCGNCEFGVLEVEGRRCKHGPDQPPVAVKLREQALPTKEALEVLCCSRF